MGVKQDTFKPLSSLSDCRKKAAKIKPTTAKPLND